MATIRMQSCRCYGRNCPNGGTYTKPAGRGRPNRFCPSCRTSANGVTAVVEHGADNGNGGGSDKAAERRTGEAQGEQQAGSQQAGNGSDSQGQDGQQGEGQADADPFGSDSADGAWGENGASQQGGAHGEGQDGEGQGESQGAESGQDGAEGQGEGQDSTEGANGGQEGAEGQQDGSQDQQGEAEPQPAPKPLSDEVLKIADDFVTFVQGFRTAVEATGAPLLITPRASEFGAAQVADGVPVESVIEAWLWQGADPDTRATVQRALTVQPPKYRTNPRRYDATAKRLAERGVPVFHADLPKIIRDGIAPALRFGKPVNIALYGAAGGGKSTMARQIARAFGLRAHVHPISSSMTAYDMTGYHAPGTGAWVKGVLEDAFCNGGVVLLDEADAAAPDVMTAIQSLSALKPGEEYEFGNGRVGIRHANFFLILGMNTNGQGADDVYVGREQQDGAIRTRFAFYRLNYDLDLERRISVPVPMR